VASTPADVMMLYGCTATSAARGHHRASDDRVLRGVRNVRGRDHEQVTLDRAATGNDRDGVRPPVDHCRWRVSGDDGAEHAERHRDGRLTHWHVAVLWTMNPSR
jgi:hypothetical protein